MIKKQANYNYEILNLLNESKEEFPKLHNHLKKLEPLSVIDLGCSVPENLFILYHEFTCNILQGVDKDSEETCVRHYRNYMIANRIFSYNDKLILEKAQTFFDVYNWFIRNGNDDVPKITDENEFNKIFLTTFNKDKYLHKFLEKTQSKYHLVIASNILHFYPDDMKILLQGIKDILYPNGILIIRVQEKDNYGSPFNYQFFCDLLEEHFVNGEIYEYHKGNSWTHSIYINIPNLIQK